MLDRTLLLVLATGGIALMPRPATGGPSPDDMAVFVSSMRSCAAGTASQPHPLMKSFTITHVVTGIRHGRCDYSQTMPGGMRMLCRFDDAAREAYADELERTAKTGRMSGSSKGPQPTWSKACEIETKDGKRLPMGS